jgi:hypothetical protein
MIARAMTGENWWFIVRSLTVSAYGILFGLSTFTAVAAIRRWNSGQGIFGGEGWRVIFWVELGIAVQCVSAFVSRYTALVDNHPPDARFWVSIPAVSVAIFGQYLALRLAFRAPWVVE